MEAGMKMLFGIVLILAGSAVGQATKTPQPSKQPKPSVEANATQNRVGRYQIFFSPHARADVYLVDTETGQIWKPITITNAQDTNFKGSTPEVWVYQDRVDNEQEFDVWMAFHKPSTPAATSPR
jgi:hypothetical protein